jgi:hypothetical protein
VTGVEFLDLLAEVKRRNVYEITITYAVVVLADISNRDGLALPRARDERRGLSLGRRFTGGGEQFCPRLVGRIDKSGHFESRAGLKRLDGRDGM